MSFWIRVRPCSLSLGRAHSTRYLIIDFENNNCVEMWHYWICCQIKCFKHPDKQRGKKTMNCWIHHTNTMQIINVITSTIVDDIAIYWNDIDMKKTTSYQKVSMEIINMVDTILVTLSRSLCVILHVSCFFHLAFFIMNSIKNTIEEDEKNSIYGWMH